MENCESAREKQDCNFNRVQKAVCRGGLQQLLMAPEPHNSSPEFQVWHTNFLGGCKALLDKVNVTISAADTKKFNAIAQMKSLSE